MTFKMDESAVSLINAYRNLAELWRTRADFWMRENNSWEVHQAVKNQLACEAKARQIEQRAIRMEIY